MVVLHWCFLTGFDATSTSPPSLGLLITALKHVCDGYYSAVDSVQQLQKKVDNVRNMTSEEMKQVSVNKTKCNCFYLPAIVDT